MQFCLFRRRLSFFLILGLAVIPAFAQKGTGSGNPPAGSAGTGNFPSPNNPTAGPGLGRNPNTPFPGSQGNSVGLTRPIFLQGRVLFDDGSTPNSNIRIERVCSGNPHFEAHTDSKGRFSFQVGQNSSFDTDAADSSISGNGMPGRSPYGGASNGGISGNGSPFGMSNRANPLWSCDLRASYPGYRSDEVSLSQRRSMDDPEVGTIILHRLGNVQGTTISLTSALAPKHAQKEYEKGMQLISKGKFEEAEKHLLGATEDYPKYAVAWFALGEIQEREAKTEDARKSYQAAIAADSRYVSPYDQLALLSAHAAKWEDAATFSKQAIDLNPVEFPSSFWYNALANYQLKKPEEAEKSARALLKLDTAHKYPQAENLLAQLLLDKGQLTEAATHMRAYLALAPDSKEAPTVKQALAKVDQAAAEVKK